MTVLFYDINQLNDPIVTQDRTPHARFDNILFADDTVILSTTHAATEHMLHNIERKANITTPN